MVAGHLFVRHEGSPERRDRPERFEKAGGDLVAGDLFWLIDAGQVRIPPLGGRQSLQGSCFAPPVGEVAARHRFAIEQSRLWITRHHHDDPVNGGKPERPEHDGVEEGEADAVGRQREGERRHDHRAGARLPCDCAARPINP
ncbi:MAG TPA: hypothetical protein VMO26_16585 [Vicinamibacterales bacterium]|nr:hypothetical protein [Vicinamibacterales bacterium]